jgi:hypothetical protein
LRPGHPTSPTDPGGDGTGRTWAVDDWRAFYPDHPVTGVFGRLLVWECYGDAGTTWTAGWPAIAGDRWWLTDRAGRPLPGDGSATTMRLWHPIRATSADDGRVWRQAELAELPPLVLSEAMRDVDLAVGVASIAADPTWEDRGDTRHLNYWRQWSFGELTESAKMRREALVRLMPRTRIADRVQVTDRFLRVRGDLRTYKIHLGSGNVLMEPNDAYLCIVTSRDVTAERVVLPFEEHGGLLSVILSKAFLLAADASIADPTITRQIRR